MAISNFI